MDTAVMLERPIAPPEPPKARPVLWWAALGAVFVILQVYVFTRWLIDLPPNIPAGPTDVPWWMAFNIHAQEVVFPAALAFMFYRFVVRPLRRGRPVTWDGVFMLAFLTMLWQNMTLDFFKWSAGYNAVVINRGSWYDYVPFFTAPNANENLAEAPIWNLGFYGVWAAVSIWICFFTRAMKQRWPHLSKVRLFVYSWIFCMVLDFAVETLWMRGGLYHFGGAPRATVLFAGHYYQYPIYEMVWFGLCLAALAAVRYFRNDRGESVAERGIDEVRLGTKSKTIIRWLALAGILNVICLTYNVGMSWVAFRYGSDWPADIQKRSYFTQGLCGAKTNRPCTGHQDPLPMPGSAYITYGGGVAHPPGWKPAEIIPFAE